MKVPAMKRKVQSEMKSILPMTSPMTTPKKHKILDNTLNKMARLIDRPFFLSTAKSPISCGNSWKNTAIVVPKPVVRLDANEAPIARPSLKLCKPSPSMIISIDVLKPRSWPWWWLWLWPCIGGEFRLLCLFSKFSSSSVSVVFVFPCDEFFLTNFVVVVNNKSHVYP